MKIENIFYTNNVTLMDKHSSNVLMAAVLIISIFSMVIAFY